MAKFTDIDRTMPLSLYGGRHMPAPPPLDVLGDMLSPVNETFFELAPREWICLIDWISTSPCGAYMEDLLQSISQCASTGRPFLSTWVAIDQFEAQLMVELPASSNEDNKPLVNVIAKIKEAMSNWRSLGVSEVCIDGFKDPALIKNDQSDTPQTFKLPSFSKPITQQLFKDFFELWRHGHDQWHIAEVLEISQKKVSEMLNAYAANQIPTAWVEFKPEIGISHN